MVKARFPGKPSKHFNRRKVHAVNSEDNEGINAEEDVYRRFSMFNTLFHTEDEDNIFHGFSPHECDKKVTDHSRTAPISSSSRKNKKGQFSPRKYNSSKISANNAPSKGSVVPKSEKTKTLSSEGTIPAKEINIEPLQKPEHRDILPSNPTLSGKFVLPSRSAHSSRVIKPNKRFLQNDISNVPYKKSRLLVTTEVSPGSEEHKVVNFENKMKLDYDHCYNKTENSVSSSSPVKFVLRKPRLKIKSQPLSTVGGPFSSPSGSTLSSQGLKQQCSSVTKVFCGVCGSLRTYKFFRQARKFGIFSCDPCRKFILKMIRSERQNVLQPLICATGNGNCPIRHNSLIAQCFSSEAPDKNRVNEQERCEACWLNVCLQSFRMPPRLTKRLSTFLPSQISQFQTKPVLVFNKCHATDWSDISNGSQETLLNSPELRLTYGNNCESRVIRRNKGLRENINIRRGSTASLRLSSHRGRGLREFDEMKRGRGRQKLPVAGPRVKHVCRSASLVLGQPVATFDPSNTSKGDPVLNSLEPQTSEDRQVIEFGEDEWTLSNLNEKGKKPNSLDTEQTYKEQNDIDYPPVARMLQDLGRANCELLDGMENHEIERLNARVSIDFWESYDPEEVSQMGFPLIGFDPLRLKALCFLCGSAGLEKMVHCASCCEPYHTFCVPNLNVSTSGDWWRLDWFCPKCTQCEACLKSGGTQLSCTKCQKSYHSSCISTVRANISDNNWVCPSCLFCKSCNDLNVHVFVGNMPLCKACFKLRKRGNFCPLCQCCYDDNDYNTKMMECAECKCWIHAQCEGISNEKYQVLSYLPSSIEFVCRLCCKTPPAKWSIAVNDELRAGYLNVIKILSKNKNACAMFKASPKKQRVCVCLDKHRNPIHLPNLLSSSETEPLGIESDTSPDRDYKSSDLGLLTPKLTKDDEESLKTVKTDFLNLVTQKNDSKVFSDKPMNKKADLITCNKEPQLLSIAYDKLTRNPPEELSSESKFSDKSNVVPKDKVNSDVQERVCTCQNSDLPASNSLSLLSIKNKATSDEYHSVCEFHKDMECVTNEIANLELIETYNRCLKQIFPWFDPNESRITDTLVAERETIDKSSIIESPKRADKQKLKKEEYIGLKGLLNLDQASYYIGLNLQDTRICLFCKSVGEGFPTKEGRLLYCGQNEWVHTNCALWSSEVFEEIDGSLQNVHSAVSRARLIRCVQCGKKGASLGCCAKSCPSAYHFACAINAECIFLENKEVYCKTHSNQQGDKEIHKNEDFHIKRSVYVELDHKKKKDVLRNQVRIYIGSLEVSQIGEILPELSDDSELLIPCEYKCSRLFWSWKEPWKIVRYSIETKVTNASTEYTYENDTNYTVDHSLEFTPPPSPVESINTSAFIRSDFCEKEVKVLVNQIIDTICSKEEEGNLSDQQSTDLLPPDLKDAIFNELPQDFLDRISVHDIFTKMSFDDITSESRGDKGEFNDCNASIEPFCNKLKVSDCSKDMRNKAKNIYQVVRVVKQKNLDKIKDCESYIEREKINKWKRQSIIQVDGAMDLSESDQSTDSCDIELNNLEAVNGNSDSAEDKPVKCARCHRTYRTSSSYERHLPTCNADFSSCSESDLSEEEKTQGLPEETSSHAEVCIANISNACSQVIPPNDSQPHLFNVPIEVKSITTSEHKIQTLVQNTFENSIVCVNNSDFNGLRESTESVVNINYTTINNEQVQNTSFPNEQTLVTSVESVVPEPVVGLQPSTIILQQVPGDSVLPTAFMSSTFQEPQQQNIQYITAINTQEKTQFLTANSIGPNTFHIQPQISQPVVQNVPTVVGTIIQSNGVEQLVLNNPGASLDVYGHQQNNMYITNAPMIVGMETVVSNTVMSSSRFISGAAPGMLASSYSATTTQVFQAAKPVIDLPQSYVVVNTNPQIVENNAPCVQNIIQNGNVASSSWNGYKFISQDALKLNKNITYQTMSQQISSQKQDVNGLKMINPNDQTILLTAVPTVKLQNTPGSVAIEKLMRPSQATINNFNGVNNKPPNLGKIVELPSSSAIHKEKPQQAVAPVVIKKIAEPPKNEEVQSQPQPSTVKLEATNKVDTFDQILLMGPSKNMVSPPCEDIQHLNKTVEVVCNQKEDEVPPSITTKDNSSVKNSTNMNLKAKETKSTGVVQSEPENNKKRKLVHEEPRISFEITSEDGFSFSTTSLDEAWNTVFRTVQNSRKNRGLPPLTQNPFSSPDTMLKKLMGLGNNSMKYILEQLPGISSCSKYKPVYHKKPPSALEKELSKGRFINPTGCARTEKFKHAHKTYDMFSWLASRHRRPPKLFNSDTDGLNGNSRRATSMNLPMAMRFRHLKETSKLSVGVFRSDIHGRGLFCLRDIDSGEMVIEYAGEVIRSALTDKRERYYTEKGIGCYMFRIDDKFVVDATMKGNAARFINHSCEPNCYSRVIDILGKKHILIFALRKILQGEELTYDYKFPLEEDKINCHCLSRKCRKYLN